MLNEISQTQKDIYSTIRFCVVPTGVRFLEMERRMAIARGLGTEEFFNGHRVPDGEDGNILEMDGIDGRTTM